MKPNVSKSSQKLQELSQKKTLERYQHQKLDNPNLLSLLANLFNPEQSENSLKEIEKVSLSEMVLGLNLLESSIVSRKGITAMKATKYIIQSRLRWQIEQGDLLLLAELLEELIKKIEPIYATSSNKIEIKYWSNLTTRAFSNRKDVWGAVQYFKLADKQAINTKAVQIVALQLFKEYQILLHDFISKDPEMRLSYRLLNELLTEIVEKYQDNIDLL